jgi:DNA replication protein DnaC
MVTPFETPFGEVQARNVARLTGLKCEFNPAQRTRWETRLANTWGSGTRAEWEFGQPVCRGCAQHLDATPTQHELLGSVITLPVSVCDDCMELVRIHYDGAAHEQMATSATPKWDEACPAKLREAIFGALPANVDRAAFERVKAWRPSNGKGIAMKGPSGSGKTTAYWALARELEREGRAPVTLNAVELGRILSKAARDIEQVDWLCGCSVLMIDDLGKEKSTPAMAALLWEVLDKRYGRGLPVVLSTRFTGAELRGRFGEECLGDDIMRRLNELCSGVTFKLPEQFKP